MVRDGIDTFYLGIDRFLGRLGILGIDTQKYRYLELSIL